MTNLLARYRLATAIDLRKGGVWYNKHIGGFKLLDTSLVVVSAANYNSNKQLLLRAVRLLLLSVAVTIAAASRRIFKERM